MKLYKNDDYKFTINIPEDWIIGDSRTRPEDFKTLQQGLPYTPICAFDTTNSTVVIVVGINETGTNKIDVEGYLSSLQKKLAGSADVIKAPTLKLRSDNVKTIKLLINSLGNNKEERIIDTNLFFKEGNVFNIIITASPKDYDLYKSLLEKIVLSFKFIDSSK